MTLTKQMIFAGRSSRGGWTAKQLAQLGIPWPPTRGWIGRLNGTEIHGDRYARFLQLTDGGNQDLPRLMLKDLNHRAWDDSPERFANELFKETGGDLSR